MRIELTTETLQVFLAEALEHASPYSAGNQNRTDITDLECRCNNHYTIPAFVGKVGFEPTFSTSRYVYRMYKIPTVLAEIKKPSLFETGFKIYVKSKSYIT